MYSVFSLTWPASMQIYWNKRKRLHKKRVQLPQDWFGTQTWPPFHCFRTQMWPPRRDVKTHNTCEVSVEVWFLLWPLAVCDTIGDCLRRTYSDDPGHHRHVFPIYLNGGGDLKRTDGNFFLLLKKNYKTYKRYPVSCELYELTITILNEDVTIAVARS